MGKIKFSLVTAMAAMMILFSSCLGDKDHESSGSGYGLISYSNGRYLLYGVDTYAGYPIYSETINNYANQNLEYYDERFIGVNYKINYDDEANSGYGSRGYTIGTIEIINADVKTNSSVYSRSEAIDEEVAVEDEVKPSALGIYNYVSSYLLMEASISNYHKNDEVKYYLEYSTEQPAGKYEGYNVYYVYVRITHTLAETIESRSVYTENRQFDLSNAISAFKAVERSKSSSSERFIIQFKYVSDITDSGETKFSTITNFNLGVSLSDD